jgi:YidC/Oxa1 family membrane protein insertase
MKFDASKMNSRYIKSKYPQISIWNLYNSKTNSYTVDFKVNFINLDSIISIGTTYLEMDWQEKTNILERGDKWERQNVLLSYRLQDGKVKSLKNTKDEYTEDISFKIQWLSFKQQFFNTTLINHEHFESAELTTKQLKNDTTVSHLMIATATIPFRVLPKQH